MAYWTEEQIRGLNKMLREDAKRRQEEWEHEREMEQFRREILTECRKMIEEIVPKRVDVVVKDNATPKLKEIAQTIKNLGHL